MNTSALLPSRIERNLASRETSGDAASPNLWVHTDKGPRRIADLQGRPFGAYVNGAVFSSTPEGFFPVGEQELCRLTTEEGYAVEAPASHFIQVVMPQPDPRDATQRTDWKPIGSLKPGERLVLHHHIDAFWSGDGTAEEGWLLGLEAAHGARPALRPLARKRLQSIAGIYAREEAGDLAVLLGEEVADPFSRLAVRFDFDDASGRVTEAMEEASSAFYEGFLRGRFDADACVEEEEHQIVLPLDTLPSGEGTVIQRMLSRIGIEAVLTQEALVVANQSLVTFHDRVGFDETRKAAALERLLASYRRGPNRDSGSATVLSVAPLGTAPIYDCTIPGPDAFDGNGFYLHNRTPGR